MKITHQITSLTPPKRFIGAGAVNLLHKNKITKFFAKLLKQDICNIIIYLSEFNYRKNVPRDEVMRDVNNYHLVELICAISREITSKRTPLCEFNCKTPSIICPIDNVWEQMKLRKVEN